MGEILNKLGFNTEITYIQERSLNPDDLNKLTDGLKEYFIFLKDNGNISFECLNNETWKYEVYLKKICHN